MTTYEPEKRTHEGRLIGLGLAAVWVIAAAFRPGSTFHLAPILIAGAVPLLGSRAGLRRGDVTIAGIVGLSIATASSVLLALFNLLRGPSLLPFGNAFVEAIVFAAGAVIVAGTIAHIMPTVQGDIA